MKKTKVKLELTQEELYFLQDVLVVEIRQLSDMDKLSRAELAGGIDARVKKVDNMLNKLQVLKMGR